MIEKSIEIKMAEDFDARPIAMLVQIASRHDSDIYLATEGKKVNAKSIMGVMMLAAAKGSTVNIETIGDDDEAALQAVLALIADRFGEEE